MSPKIVNKKICKIDYCKNVVEAKGYCKKHYQYLKRNDLLELSIYAIKERIKDSKGKKRIINF